MKKNNYFLVPLFLLAFFIGYGQEKGVFGGLKGNIRQFLEENFKPLQQSGELVLGEKLDTKGKRSRLTIFDEQGNRIRVNEYTVDNKISAFYVSEFDSLRCNIRTTYFSGDSVAIGYLLNGCDKSGKDSVGARYNKQDQLVDKMIWYYNEANDLIETLTYKYGNLESKITYQNDPFGNQVATSIYSAKDSLTGVYRAEFDSIGNKLVEKFYSKEKLHSIKYMKYDSNRNITEEITRNAQGKIIGKTNYVYQYDLKGNWIERRLFNFDAPEIITTRKIQYYN